MKKNDFILIIAVILIGIVLFVVTGTSTENGDTVIITRGGEIFGEYPLDTTTKIDINGTNTAIIENGTVYMQSADCPDKLCVHQGKISDSSKKIVCLPNKVVIEVTKKSEIDKVIY